MAIGRALDSLQECIDLALDSLGDALIEADMYTNDGLPIVEGYRSNSKASALFSNITDYINGAIKSSGFQTLKDYYLIHLKDNKAVLILVSKDFQWGMLIDLNKVKLGYLYSIFLPEAIESFKKAVNNR